MINQIGQVTKFVTLKSFPRFWIPVLFFVFTGGLLVTMIFVMLGYQAFYLNRSYPGVSIAGVEAGGMTHPEIVTVVKAKAATYLDRPITIQIGDEAWTFTSQQLGLGVEVTATADKAYQIGRRGNFFADMLTHLSLIFSPRYVEPVILYDQGPTNEILQQLSNVVNYPPRNGEVIVRSATEIEVIPAQRGQRLHLEATQPLIEGAIFSDGAQPVVTAFTQEIIPAITNEDIAAVSQQVQSLVTKPFVFGFSTNTDTAEWRLEPDSLATIIDIVEKPDTNGQPQLTIELDRARLAPYFEEFARVINQEPVNARLKFDNELGELTVLQYSRDGRTLDIEAAYEQAAVSVATGSNFVKLPVSLRPPTVSSDDIASLGIKELISESTSYFTGSSRGRMHNIALAASKFDGVIVPPGEIFSFNQHLGAVTSEEGYDESLIIFGDRTTVGIGGGVCQVSTTAFRTAFFGGFELVERWAHGYRVSWYETNSIVGLDATIYTPDLDFKFRNDSDHHLLIHTHTDLDAGTLTFKFYGAPTGRDVIVSEPTQTNLVKHGLPIYEETPTLPKGKTKQVDWAKDGLDVTVIRVVKDGDSIIHEDEIISHYNPWRAVYQVGTGS
jgi:vancomycin resistance protein YoaR